MPNGTKKAAVRWAEYQATIPSSEQVDRWWGNGQEYGLALICGKVSGNLEMLELEGRACTSDMLERIFKCMDDSYVRQIWEYLNGPEGYSEWSPSGGLHLLYRIIDHDVPGNSKIAQDAKYQCLAETRGDGGYVVVAPTSGLCHPTGEAWVLINGSYGNLPELTWEQRNKIHDTLREALDETPAPPPTPAPSTTAVLPRATVEGAGQLPLDAFEEQVDWADILIPAGWTQVRGGSSGYREWARPGKNPRDGMSATTGLRDEKDRLFVFSTSTIFEAGVSYTKGGAYAVMYHGGNHNAAASDLYRKGYGHFDKQAELEVLRPTTGDPKETGEEPRYTDNDDGNSRYLRDRVDGEYLWMSDEKQWFHWDGTVWGPDFRNRLELEFKEMATERLHRSIDEGNKVDVKRWTQAGNVARTEAASKAMRNLPGIPTRFSEMNPERHLLNVGNGILDLETQTLTPFDARKKMTRTFGAWYEKGATCPNFTKFMEDVLPDPGLRGYVKRALGYTLLGDVDQRAMFLIHGPSGTGKSTLMETMRYVFGDYGATAASGAFKLSKQDGAITNDLHDLRGKRFVTTSETAEGASFNEDVLKRLTGRDRIKSRELYQSNQEWIPECSIWLATNHPPRFNSDDDAIWRRAKLIPFMTRFVDEREIPDMARSVLAPEASGILNWLLEGLAEYLEMGLAEPTEVKVAAEEQRLQSDSVARFIEDKVDDGALIRGEGQEVGSSTLFTMYVEWARQTGERSLGNTRFGNRLRAHPYGFEMQRHGNRTTWRGLGRASSVSVLGNFFGLGQDP